MFDCLYRRQYSPEIFHNYFQVNSDFHDHNTRQRSNLHFELVQSSSGQRQTSFCASKFWNSLPQPLKNYTCRNSFKKALKQYLLNREWLSQSTCLLIIVIDTSIILISSLTVNIITTVDIIIITVDCSNYITLQLL